MMPLSKKFCLIRKLVKNAKWWSKSNLSLSHSPDRKIVPFKKAFFKKRLLKNPIWDLEWAGVLGSEGGGIRRGSIGRARIGRARIGRAGIGRDSIRRGRIRRVTVVTLTPFQSSTNDLIPSPSGPLVSLK